MVHRRELFLVYRLRVMDVAQWNIQYLDEDEHNDIFDRVASPTFFIHVQASRLRIFGVDDDMCRGSSVNTGHLTPIIFRVNSGKQRVSRTVRTLGMYSICGRQSIISTPEENESAWEKGSRSLSLICCLPPLRRPPVVQLRGQARDCCTSTIRLPSSLR